MLAIKLQRIGKKHQPSYRLIVQEKREKLNGRSVEDLGWYNPLLKKYEFKKERVEHWIKIGAKPTDTVHNLLITAQIISGKKIAVHAKSKKKEEVNEPGKSETATVEALKPEKAEDQAPPAQS